MRFGRKGFTVVEVLVVIGILAVTAAVAVPAYLQQLPDIRLKRAVRDLKSDMELVRLRAVRENAEAVILFDTNNDAYTAYLDNGAGGGISGNHTQEGGEPTILDRQMPVGIDMYNTLFSSWANQTFFDGRGLPSGGWGYAYMMNNKSNYRRIELSMAGLIKIQSSTDGGTWADED